MKALLLRSAMGIGTFCAFSFAGCVTITTTNPAPTYTPPTGYVQASNVEQAGRCPAACCQHGYTYAPQSYPAHYPQPMPNPQAGAYPPAQYPQPYPAQYPQPYPQSYPAYPYPYPAQYPQSYPAYPQPYPQSYPAQYPQTYPAQYPQPEPTAEQAEPRRGGAIQSAPRQQQPDYRSTPRTTPERAEDQPQQNNGIGARPSDATTPPIVVVSPTPAPVQTTPPISRTDDRVTHPGTPGPTPRYTTPPTVPPVSRTDDRVTSPGENPRYTPRPTVPTTPPVSQTGDRVTSPTPAPRITPKPHTADRMTSPTAPEVVKPRPTTEQAQNNDPKKAPVASDVITNGGTKVTPVKDAIDTEPEADEVETEGGDTRKAGVAGQD